jgi:hypothetical protein
MDQLMQLVKSRLPLLVRRAKEPRPLMALAFMLGSLAAGCGGGDGSSAGSPQIGSAPSSRTAPGVAPRGQPRSRRAASGGAYAGRHPTPGGASRARTPAAPPHTPQQRRNYTAVVATVRAVVAGIDGHDASICSNVFTRHYVESVNGLKGQAALSACEKQIRAFRGKLDLVRIERVDGNDRVAVVRFVTSLDGGKATTEILELVRTGGRWGVYAALRRGKK